MKYTLTIESTDANELANLLAAIAGNESDDGTVYALKGAAPEAEEKPRRRRRTKAEIEADEAAARAAENKAEDKAAPAATAPAPAPAATAPAPAPAATAPTAPAAPAAGTLDYAKDVRPKIMEASQSKDVGMEKVVELLAKYGAKRGQDIPVEKLPAFLADLTKLGQPAESKADDDGDGDIF